MFISNGLTSPKWSPAWPTPRLKLLRVQVHRVTIFSIWLKMGLCADTRYVQSASFSIIYFTSILLKSGAIFFGITLISDGVLSWVSWLNLFALHFSHFWEECDALAHKNVFFNLWRFLSHPSRKTSHFGNVTIRLGLKHVFLFPSQICHLSRKREAGRPFGLRPTFILVVTFRLPLWIILSFFLSLFLKTQANHRTKRIPPKCFFKTGTPSPTIQIISSWQIPVRWKKKTRLGWVINSALHDLVLAVEDSSIFRFKR